LGVKYAVVIKNTVMYHHSSPSHFLKQLY